jgi:small subunit ribosomal protein S23
MVRKLATQVPQAITRLLQAQTITPPVWYQAYLEHPPQSLPPRRLAPIDLSLFSRSSASGADEQKRDVTHRAKRAKTPKLKVPELRFQEDEIRRRFFTDFPFEALRPVSLIEGQTIDEGRTGVVDGEQWTELRQRGEVPTVEE